MQMLVVDDDLHVQDLMAACLRTHGHTVLVADGAAAALAAVDRHGMPEAVVLDVTRPDADGVTLLHRLRQRVPGLPALLLTWSWKPADLAPVPPGNVGFLAKPFTYADLFRAVGELSARSV
ncbi:response regulator [Krasilnikovia cinnamomea]|uniref:response regulator n=1 Tax=Krasilnikovia cinnamomea TaxID=349313 RepID=UPI0013EF3D2B|nr:response regulator [Krasilnikovia cinnamomea]